MIEQYLKELDAVERLITEDKHTGDAGYSAARIVTALYRLIDRSTLGERDYICIKLTELRLEVEWAFGLRLKSTFALSTHFDRAFGIVQNLRTVLEEEQDS